MPPRLRHDAAQRQRFGTPQELACPLCGASVTFAPRLRLVDCPQCAAPLVRGPDDATPLAPTGVLRFHVDPAAVPGLAAAGVKRFWAARPEGATLSSFERIYVPIWRFSTHVVCNWVQEHKGADSLSPSRTTGEFSADYDRQVVASTDINGQLLQLLEDVPLGAAEPVVNRLAGVRILRVDVPLQDAWVTARGYFDSEATAGSWREGYSVHPHWSREEGALVLVPAYLGYEATRNVTVPVLVDGVSGAVHGGIGNHPFTASAPMPRGCRRAIAVTLIVGVAWIAYIVLGWLGLSVLDVLDLLHHVLE